MYPPFEAYSEALNHIPLIERGPINWEELEIISAIFLNAQGYASKRSVKLKGKTAEHDVDVLGKMVKGGIEFLIIIECKFLNRKVKKETVAQLSSIMEDIGSSKGIIVSKKGFQKGAINFVKNRPIELIELDDILTKLRINTINYIYQELGSKIDSLYWSRITTDRISSLLKLKELLEKVERSYYELFNLNISLFEDIDYIKSEINALKKFNAEFREIKIKALYNECSSLFKFIMINYDIKKLIFKKNKKNVIKFKDKNELFKYLFNYYKIINEKYVELEKEDNRFWNSKPRARPTLPPYEGD